MGFLRLIKDSALYWHRNQAARLSAALTYYALASLAPMMVLLLSIASLFFNPERAAALLTGPVAVAIGSENAHSLRSVIENAYNPGANLTAGGLSALVILLTGSELFRQLSFAMNRFWNVEKQGEEVPIIEKARRIVLRHLRYRLRAFLLVLGAGLLLLGTLITATLIGVADRHLGGFVETPFNLYGWGNRVFSFASSLVLFALIFRYVPRVRVSWRSVWAGALIAGILFLLLQELARGFLVTNRVTSAYGAAASLVILLFWLYYSIQAIFFGAAWTIVIEREKPA